jgi:hypothetical protein
MAKSAYPTEPSDAPPADAKWVQEEGPTPSAMPSDKRSVPKPSRAAPPAAPAESDTEDRTHLTLSDESDETDESEDRSHRHHRRGSRQRRRLFRGIGAGTLIVGTLALVVFALLGSGNNNNAGAGPAQHKGKPGTILVTVHLADDPEPLRDVKVTLLRPTIRREAAVECLTLLRQQWTRYAQEERRIASELSSDRDLEGSVRWQEQQAQDADSRINEIDGFIAGLGPRPETITVWEEVRRMGRNGLPPFGPVVDDGRVQTANDLERVAYLLDNVPPGEYCIYAEYASETVVAAWLKRVDAGSGKLDVDLIESPNSEEGVIFRPQRGNEAAPTGPAAAQPAGSRPAQ